MAEKGIVMNKILKEDKDLKTAQKKWSVLKRLVRRFISPDKEKYEAPSVEELHQEMGKGCILLANKMLKADTPHPKTQRALCFYYCELGEMRQYATYNQLLDMFFKELDIVVPEEDKYTKEKLAKYFTMAEEILPEKDSKFEEWTKLYA